jgi:3-methyladenine DNA glycosylase AlkD
LLPQADCSRRFLRKQTWTTDGLDKQFGNDTVDDRNLKRTTMNAKEIIGELKPLGNESTKRVLANHGIREPFFGVKIGDLKKIQQRIKKDYQLALDLYDTENYDAMYLAGLIADDAKMTKANLRRWIAKAYCGPLAGSTVAWVASGSPHGHELALEWIDSKEELVAEAGWATLSSRVSIKPDAELDLAELKRLLRRVEATIHKAPNAVRYCMNGFVIAVGTYVLPLTDFALQIAEKIGAVTVDMGNTACQVPSAPDAILKIKKRGAIGKKRKSAKC